MLTVVADAHIWDAEYAFCRLPGYTVSLRVLEAGEITNAALKDTDILLTRSSTKVNATLLEGTPVRFVATATIGDDHVDRVWLRSQGIAFANAAGSSTGSVLEYMLAVLLDLHTRKIISIADTTLGIIGAGRIGGQLAVLCERLGVQVIICDPPRARIEGSEGFCSMDDILHVADVLTLHTPLIRSGTDCTVHLLNALRLGQFCGKGVINAARGAVVDNTALANWLDAGNQRFAVMDCWADEPNISRRLLAHQGVLLATPHIAGHSLDGKAANTQYAYNALCHYLGIKPDWDMTQRLPPVSHTPINIASDAAALHDLADTSRALYDIQADHQRLKATLELDHTERAQSFRDMRRYYPVRRAWDLSAFERK